MPPSLGPRPGFRVSEGIGVLTWRGTAFPDGGGAIGGACSRGRYTWLRWQPVRYERLDCCGDDRARNRRARAVDDRGVPGRNSVFGPAAGPSRDEDRRRRTLYDMSAEAKVRRGGDDCEHRSIPRATPWAVNRIGREVSALVCSRGASRIRAMTAIVCGVAALKAERRVTDKWVGVYTP